MEHIEPVLLGLLVAVAALSVIAQFVRIPYPILMVLGGLGLGLIPGAPEVSLNPDVVLVVFLPPLLYVGAFFASLRDVRRDARVIGLMAIGLVGATAIAVAVVAHELAGLPWAAAFTLGAIVSPTDPLAATQIMRRLGAPRRLVNVLEGEGLVNDATALVLYRTAIAAAVGGSFSAWDAGLGFLLAPIGGILVGLAVAWIIAEVRRRVEDVPTEITISVFTGYAAYFPAEALGASGVLAAVTAGIYLGFRAPEIASSESRLQGFSFWTITQFLLNATLFVLIGLQLPQILDGLTDRSAMELLVYGAAVSGVVIGVRFAWIFATTVVIRVADRRPDQLMRRATWQARAIASWAGMRGAVSLAAALAVPVATDAGDPFPGRDLILWITFCVILATLVFQGLTLPWLIRLLGVHDDGEEERREELKARIAIAAAALDRIDELEGEPWVRAETLERMRGQYRYRKRRFAAQAGKIEDEDGIEDQSQGFQRATREVITAERRVLVAMRDQGTISNDVMHKVERELDLEDSRLELPPDGRVLDGRRARDRE
ncbi:MAG TPA: Na+/H+ antiporter [Miltoncostaeaceae bacterium]|nr:Na+/H+ antiporter [Miltoncostaeaceae bacterium]